MKKILLMIVGAVLVCACCLAACGFAARALAAEILYVEGTVQVQSSTDSVWNKAEKGMKVDIGDVVRTARHSRADIAFDAEKKNTVRLEEKTLVVLNSSSADVIDKVELARGRVYSNLENLQSGMAFEVSTPSAIAGVRGSSYMVYTEKDEDEVSAFKDDVYIKTYDSDKNQSMDTTLPEGFKTFISRFETPSALTQITNREFSRFDRIKEELLSHIETRERVEEGEQEQGKLEPSALEQTGEQGAVINEVSDTKENTEDSNVEQQINDLRLESGGHHFE